ncbi:MAG: hypothetical protein HY887_09375 [Deltaproteobacteria bacterium]|nr:hypothetical protein [Deltaproteobacteria bacterium]
MKGAVRRINRDKKEMRGALRLKHGLVKKVLAIRWMGINPSHGYKG